MGLPGEARARFDLPVHDLDLGERLTGAVALAGLLVGHFQEQPVGSVALAVPGIPPPLGQNTQSGRSACWAVDECDRVKALMYIIKIT
jgi:hypothetical protein